MIDDMTEEMAATKPRAKQGVMLRVPDPVAEAIHKYGAAIRDFSGLREAVAAEVFKGMSAQRVREIAENQIKVNFDTLD